MRSARSLTVAAVSRRAAVSRTFLYSIAEAQALLADATADTRARKAQDLAGHDVGQEATWRERELNAEDALKAAHAEIIQQRERIGELLGQVRDLEAEWTQEAIQRIATENTTLKQRVRQLTADNRILDERLKAARSNLRFQDRRIADLEPRLLDPPKK
jgi:TolA-binding protein